MNPLSDYELVTFNNKMISHFYDFVELSSFSEYVEGLNIAESAQLVEFNYIEVISDNRLFFISKEAWTSNGKRANWAYETPVRDIISHNRHQSIPSLLGVHFVRFPYHQGKMTIADHIPPGIAAAAKTMYAADPVKYNQLWSSLKISEIAKQKEKMRVSSQRQSKNKRSENFTVPQQKYIARQLMGAILGQNYLAQAARNLKSNDVDRTGDKLIEALSIFNIDVEQLLDQFATHSEEHSYDKENASALRRFVMQKSAKNYSTLGLIDNDELVRFASEKKSKLED